MIYYYVMIYHVFLTSMEVVYGYVELDPFEFNLILYRPVLAVMNRVWPSSPHAQFAGISGVSILPKSSDSGENTQMPPGPVE